MPSKDIGADGRSYGIGGKLGLVEKIRQELDNRSEAGHNARVNIGNTIVEVTPNFETDNISPGSMAGAILAVIAKQGNAIVPVDVLSETEIAAAEPKENSTVYTVNVDAALPQQAKFQAMMEAGTGFTSLITDEFDVGNSQSLRKRIGRTTWQYQVEVFDNSNSSGGPLINRLGITSSRE